MKCPSVRMVLAGLLLGAALSACVVTPAGGEVVAYAAPPPVQYEVVGIAPAPGYFWVGGAWFWEAGRYNWHRGYWSAPRPGYRWVPHAWTNANGAWRARPGHWERERR
jgi:hypothetical protein